MNTAASVRFCRCGTRIARDNSDALCNSCRKTSRSLLTGPPDVPESFWHEPRLRDGLESWHIGKVIAAYRLHPWHGQPIPQQIVASWLGVSQARLSRLENGEPLQDLARLSELAQLFVIPPELLWFKIPGSPVTFSAEPRPVRQVHDLADDVAAQSLAFASRASQLAEDPGMLEHVRWELSRIAVDYVHAPIDTIFGDLVQARDAVFGLLAEQRCPTETRELYVLGGTACLLLAQASQNLGNSRSALAQLRTAWTCATVADHNALRAWSRGTAALFSEWSSQQTVALELIAQGKQYNPSRESRIRLSAIEARAAARSGNRRRAEDALAKLRDAQADPGGHDDLTQLGGILSFPDAKQNYYIGSTHGLLGDHQTAERFALAAIRAYENGPAAERSYGDEALARMDVVNARAKQGDLDGAEEALQPVLVLPAERRIDQLRVSVIRTAHILQQHPGGRSTTGRTIITKLRAFKEAAPLAITST